MFKIILLFVFIFINNSFADIYFEVPDSIELQELNKGTPKTLNRYNKVEQIENQYRGKLKYKPSNNLFRYDRKGRYFTSVFFMLNNNSFKTAEDISDGVKYKFDKNSIKNTVSAELGRYFFDNLFLSLEYFEYNGGDAGFSYKSGNYEYDLLFEHKSRNYFINIGIENNYSRLIPVLGGGLGVVVDDFEKKSSNFISGIISKTEIESKIMPAFQLFAGFDFLLADNFFLVFRYKYFSLIGDFEIEVKDTYSSLKYKLELEKNNNSFMIGFKYLW